ncbi:MAG TPA: TonB-dependent receptor [Bryobacteraceae bacterium]|nr:TonB-dependent receptor [Bryobacteraceae bacterium]
MRWSALVVLTVAMSAGLFAQEFRGTLSGGISDPTGAMIAGAKVSVTETHTGTKTQTVSNDAGQYTVPFLAPGDYDIDVEATGFKESVRKAIHLGSGDHTVIDFKLDVGEASQTVEVTGAAPLINSENDSVGQAVTTNEVEDLPLNGRTPLVLASLSIGVIGVGQPGLIHPFDSGGAAGWSIGSYAQTNEILINGSPDATWDGRLAFSPPQDAVQEVSVQAFNSDAAFGHTGGGTINQVMKTGTNSLHGSLYEFNEPNTLTANDFFNNQKGLKSPLTHYNQYGLTAGGPIFIPKVFDGRNKLFWFFAWENLKDSQPNANFTTVPTDAEKNGDFSQILAADKTQLYDPFTAVQNGTVISRTAYPNNQIPKSELNPIAQAYMQFYPEPNVAPTRPDGYQNFGNNATTNDDYNNELGRLDYNMSNSSRMFFDIRRTGYSQIKNNYFNNISEGSILFRNNWGGTVDEVYTVNPSNVIDLRVNFTRMAEAHALPSSGYDPTALGFPAYLAGNSEYLQLPVISFSSTSGFQSLGASGANTIPSQSGQIFADWMKIQSNHTLKFGVDMRQYRLNTFTAGNATGSFSFNNSWVRAASNSSSTVATGQDLASFLLGLPASGTYDLNTYGSWYSYYFSAFAQDDWRVKRNLTINLGVRFDHDGPYHEKWGRTVTNFDGSVTSPFNAAAAAAYAQSPIPQIPVGSFNVRGGLIFPSSNNAAVYENTSHPVSPRIGLAWTPDALHGKTVFRAGFGMFVSPVTISTLAITGSYSTNPITNQEGFSQSTAMTVTNDNFLTPAATLSDPFPSGFLQPAGSSAGLTTFAGQNVSFLNPEMKSPYSLRWNFDIQHTLSPNLMLEVAYIGNHGVHLPVAVTQVNGIPRQYLSTLGTRDQALITELTSSVANPLYGLVTSGTPAGKTTNPAQLLAAYPQFPLGYSGGNWSGGGGVLEQNLSVGSSYFDSLNVHLQKRFSQGLSLTFNYIYSRLIENDSWLNDTDPRPEKRVSPSDRPQRVVAAFSYELPFGPGRLFHVQSHWARLLAEGWHVNGVYTFQVGAPITWVNGSSSTPGDYIYFGGPLNLNNRDVNGTAFDKSVFDTNSADALNYHIRTFSTTFPNLRADGVNQLDASMLKRFNITEHKYFELRAEIYNVPNHPVFAAPNTQATNSAFGTITATANRFRMVQLAGKFVF